MIKLMQIIPALITEDDDVANDFDELKVKFEKIRHYLDDFQNWVQIDISDGKFVATKTNAAIPEFKYFTDLASVDFHLMIKNPDDVMEEWLDNKPERITIHIESTDKIPEIIERCRDKGAEIGLALNLETPNTSIEPWVDKVDMILYMGVHPGRGGQQFISSVLSKISELRQKYPDVKIGVDGGIKVGIARQLKEIGVDIAVVGSAIFESLNISDALRALIKDAQ